MAALERKPLRHSLLGLTQDASEKQHRKKCRPTYQASEKAVQIGQLHKHQALFAGAGISTEKKSQLEKRLIQPEVMMSEFFL